MYVFGGSLLPSEDIVSELWRLNLSTFQWTPLFNISEGEGNSSAESAVTLPVAVRGHTAHVVGSKMVVLFGMSPGETIFPSYIQEYDFGELPNHRDLQTLSSSPFSIGYRLEWLQCKPFIEGPCSSEMIFCCVMTYIKTN